ncbi:hypothetical protein CHISP_1994 [Chitinispirillum alkaliphilum]|nr:hypothetical protein CHISP_1994 [Chitinispirillum alkaliphilum]
MKKKIVIAFILFLLSFKSAYSQDVPTYEFGVIVGQPTGVSAKYWVGSRTAFDAAAAWSLWNNGSLELHATYLYHPLFLDVDTGELPVYVGLGPAFYLRDDLAIGARFPFGISYLFDELPLSLFLEIAPVVEVLPETDFDITGGAGVRIAF